MKRSAFMEAMFQKYGNCIMVFPKYKNKYQIKGFIRPLSFKKLPNSNEIGIPFDHTEDGGYIYLGSCRHRIDRELEETQLEQHGVRYWIVKSRAVFVQNKPIYICAVLQQVVL